MKKKWSCTKSKRSCSINDLGTILNNKRRVKKKKNKNTILNNEKIVRKKNIVFVKKIISKKRNLKRRINFENKDK